MGNVFVNVPVPAGNGAGAPVNISSFGISKTISVAGPFDAAVTVEISNELVPTQWAPIITFNTPDGIVREFAARWIRTSVTGYKSGTPACDIGGSDDGALFASLPATAGNGAGAAVDTSTLPLFKTVTVGGPFGGTVQIEVSEDGITDWSQLGFGFQIPGQQSQKMTARFMRVVRSGVPSIAPGLPIVDVGACNDGSDAPSGAGVFALPEQWALEDVQTDTEPVEMSAHVSTNFDRLRTVRSGSLIGLAAQLTAAPDAGSITLRPTKNGVDQAGLSLVIGTGSTGGQVAIAVGSVNYVAGDRIGMELFTSGDFSPPEGGLTVEAWLEAFEEG